MLKRLTILPALLVLIVAGIPFIWGDHPVDLGFLKQPAQRAVQVTRDVRDRILIHPATPSRPQVQNRWQPGDVQRGIQVYWADDASPLAVVRSRAQTTVDYVIGLHANALSISFPFYTKNSTSSKVVAGKHTPSADRMAILVEEAQRAGLRVTIRPILDEQSLQPPTGWRGNIAPTSPAKWFNSYIALLWPYLGMAEREHAATFVLGAELNSMESSGYWGWLINSAKQQYKGELAYDANWDHYANGQPPPATQAHGVDAYFPAKVADDASVATIAKVWNRWLDQHAKGSQPGTVFSEVGIGSRAGAYRKPSNYTIRGSYDPNVQPTWYQAVCDVMEQRQISGIYFWKTNFGDGVTTRTPIEQGHLDFTGYAASEQAIRACFDRLQP